MKKVILNLLVAASAVFGFEDVETFLNHYQPDEKYFTLGDVRNSDKRVIGTAHCVNGKYTVTARVANLNTGYMGTVDRVYDTPTLNNWCNIVNNATEVKGTEWVNNNQMPGGREYYFTDGTYDNCYYIRKEYHLGEKWVVAQEQTCLTQPHPLTPLEKMPVLPIKGSVYTEEKAAPILNTIMEWNRANGKLDVLWIDQGEERFRPTREQFQEIVNGADSGGIIYDSDFSWYAIVWGNRDGSLGYTTTDGNPEYRKMRDSMLVGMAEVETMARNNDYRFEYRYYYDCVQANSGRGDNHFYGAVIATVYDGRDKIETKPIKTYLVPNSEGTFACNNSMKGAILSSTEFWAYASASRAVLAPIYIKK